MERVTTKKKRAFEVLKRCEVFLGLTDEELWKIASLPSCRLRNFKAGSIIFREGEEAKTLYVINDGRIMLTIKLTTEQGVQEEVVDIVTKGGILGWSVLVAPYMLTRNAKCIVPSKLLLIDGKELREFLDREPKIGYEIMKGLVRIIANRLRDTQSLLVSGKRRVTI